MSEIKVTFDFKNNIASFEYLNKGYCKIIFLKLPFNYNKSNFKIFKDIYR